MMLRRVPVRRAAVRLAPFGLALAAFLFGTAFGRQSGSRGPLLFEEVFRLIQGRALDSVPPDSIYSMAARGLVSELGDPYAALWTPKESNDYLRNGIGDAYGGLGMGIESRGGDFVNVSDVFAGSPAARGG